MPQDFEELRLERFRGQIIVAFAPLFRPPLTIPMEFSQVDIARPAWLSSSGMV
jgi:hypothetical protein